MHIDMIHPNVPGEHLPLWWDLDLGTEANVSEMDRWIDYYDKFIPPGVEVDEVSLLTEDPTYVAGKLSETGWSCFNSASDVVFTNPFGTRYAVNYDFYRRPDVPWRLEVMQITGGFSPLHAALEWYTDPRLLAVPHLSFKPERCAVASGSAELETLGRSYSRAVQHLKDNAAIPAQTCQSTYGVFGYYLGNDATRQVYLKPRINTRDEDAVKGA